MNYLDGGREFEMLAAVTNLNAVRVLTSFTQTDSPPLRHSFLGVHIDRVHHYPLLDVQRSTIHLHIMYNHKRSDLIITLRI